MECKEPNTTEEQQQFSIPVLQYSILEYITMSQPAQRAATQKLSERIFNKANFK